MVGEASLEGNPETAVLKVTFFIPIFSRLLEVFCFGGQSYPNFWNLGFLGLGSFCIKNQGLIFKFILDFFFGGCWGILFFFSVF